MSNSEDVIDELWVEFLDEVLSDSDDDEIIKAFGKVTEAILNDLNDEDFEINPPQWLKLMHIIEVFSNYAQEHNGKLLPVELSPRMMVGGVTAEFPLIYLQGNEVFDAAELMCGMCAVSIDAKLDGTVCLSVNVPNVFKPKAK